MHSSCHNSSMPRIVSTYVKASYPGVFTICSNSKCWLNATSTVPAVMLRTRTSKELSHAAMTTATKVRRLISPSGNSASFVSMICTPLYFLVSQRSLCLW
jgi:hypothetical protein